METGAINVRECSVSFALRVAQQLSAIYLRPNYRSNTFWSITALRSGFTTNFLSDPALSFANIATLLVRHGLLVAKKKSKSSEGQAKVDGTQRFVRCPVCFVCL